MIAARALVGLGEIAFESRVRHIEQGLRGAELRDAVFADVERAARLLETGLWSFNLLTQGRRTKQQVLDAAKAAEDARAQVVQALRQARTAWRQIREETREAMREQQARSTRRCASCRRATAAAKRPGPRRPGARRRRAAPAPRPPPARRPSGNRAQQLRASVGWSAIAARTFATPPSRSPAWAVPSPAQNSSSWLPGARSLACT